MENIEGRFDLIICNPPYIPTGDINGLDIEVRDFEPWTALDGGVDGLDFFRRLTDIGKYLNESGAAFFECGQGQAEAISAMYTEAGYRVEILKDLDGVERIIKILVAGDQ